MTDKKELRAILKEQRRAVKNKEEKNRDIISKILAMPEVKNAEALFVFYPLKDEVNLLPVAEYGFREGKKVGFPLCEDKNGNMSFRLVNSLSELKEGSFGIKEPDENTSELPPKKAVIFLPALAIDKEGYRLGYGKGYYDRYLAKYAYLKPYTVGVIYKELIFDKLPRGEYDIPCDAVVCEE